MKRRPSGFTLVEILVAIGILVLLAAITVPLVGKAMRSAKRTRTAADMAVISTSLEAYKNDHGDFPRVAIVTSPGGFQSTADRPNPSTGAQVLCRAMLGLADATDLESYPTTVVNGQTVPLVHLKQDGKDGPGFRLRTGGKSFGPYLNVESFNVSNASEPLLQELLDGDGNPILYFPAVPGSRVHTTANSYVGRSMANEVNTFTYDAADNFEAFRRNGEADPAVLARIRVAFGDTDNNGRINGSEQARFSGPFVLWAAGADGRFGPDADMASPGDTLDQADVERMDDVTQ